MGFVAATTVLKEFGFGVPVVAEHVKELIQSWTVRGLKLLNRDG